MFFLIAPLLFIGLLSPAYSVTQDSENKNEHLISLRDYDFVGEDQRLSALLAHRMAVLQAPLNLSELEAKPSPAPAPAPAVPRVNVSINFAKHNNASLLTLAPEPVGAPARRYGRAPAPGIGSPSYDARLGRVDGRRDTSERFVISHAELAELQKVRDNLKIRNWDPYRDPAFLDYTSKILGMMKQCIYSSQRKMKELNPIIHKYERDPRFRMAFIYKRLQEWLHDMRTGVFYLLNWRLWRTRVKKIIWYYEHLLRLNINITYSIEHLVYLHAAYMKNLDEMFSPEQREQMKKQLKKFKGMQALGLNMPNIPH